MAGRIPQEFINDLLDRIDVSEVIGARLELKRAGKEFKGLCPFHGEKTPSFHVVPEKGFYHCFGCGVHGTALTFLLEHDRLEFVQAVETLAAMAGVEVPREAGVVRKNDRRSALFAVLERADRWFQLQLRQHPDRAQAVEYLKGRGLTGATAKRFGIGYAPPGYENLLKALGGGQTLEQQLLEAGLLASRERGGSYDRFRDRITFPIRDGRGRTIGFGGRVLGDGQPKYLNSPETPVFHKGRELYGLWECRQTLRDPERVLLVEGYMDVVGLAQAGVPEACAALGTAATADHLEKLFRLAPEVVLCFDGDAAGRRAAWKAAQLALDALNDGVSVRVLFLPEGEDPDSLVAKEGAEAFRARVAKAEALSSYLFRTLGEGLDLSLLDDRSRLAHRARPLLERIPGQLVKTLMYQRLAELTALPQGALEAAPEQAAPVDAYADGPFPEDPLDLGGPAEARRPEAPRARSRVRRDRAERALALLLKRPDLADAVPEMALLALSEHRSEAGQLLAELLTILQQSPGLSASALLGRYVGTPAHERLLSLASAPLPFEGGALSAEFMELLGHLQVEGETEKRRALLERIRTGEAQDGDLEAFLALKRAAAGVDPQSS
jgi:DNA primase